MGIVRKIVDRKAIFDVYDVFCGFCADWDVLTSGTGRALRHIDDADDADDKDDDADDDDDDVDTVGALGKKRQRDVVAPTPTAVKKGKGGKAAGGSKKARKQAKTAKSVEMAKPDQAADDLRNGAGSMDTEGSSASSSSSSSSSSSAPSQSPHAIALAGQLHCRFTHALLDLRRSGIIEIALSNSTESGVQIVRTAFAWISDDHQELAGRGGDGDDDHDDGIHDDEDDGDGVAGDHGGRDSEDDNVYARRAKRYAVLASVPAARRTGKGKGARVDVDVDVPIPEILQAQPLAALPPRRSPRTMRG
jgi:hypothetical protein